MLLTWLPFFRNLLTLPFLRSDILFLALLVAAIF